MKTETNKSWIKLYRCNKREGWQTFLERYNQLILALIQKHVRDYDEAMEVYTFILEHLKEQDCQKLTSYFQKKRNYNFEAWIVVVSRNCMFDWFRKEKGRKRLLKIVESLPAIDRLIFKYIFQHGYSHGEAYEILKSTNGFDISFEEMYSRAEKINNSLQHQTRWRLLNEWRFILPPLPLESIEKLVTNPNTPNPCPQENPSPEKNLIERNISKILNGALQKLSSEDRLIVELHIYRSLTLQEIAGILKEKRAWKVRRKFYKALLTMKDSLKDYGIEAADFDMF